jgi:hypothetical protein
MPRSIRFALPAAPRRLAAGGRRTPTQMPIVYHGDSLRRSFLVPHHPSGKSWTFHELYHVSPAFDGDIRRFGKNDAHGSSTKQYNALRGTGDAYLDQLEDRYMVAFSTGTCPRARTRLSGRRFAPKIIRRLIRYLQTALNLPSQFTVDRTLPAQY